MWNRLILAASSIFLLALQCGGQQPASFTPQPQDMGLSDLAWLNTSGAQSSAVRQVMMQSPAAIQELTANLTPSADAQRFSGGFSDHSRRFNVGLDLYSPPDFEDGLIVYGKDVAMKFGGYVKADFIYDFAPIDNTDAFAVPSIPVDAAQRTNARFHVRQTRLSFDTRWVAQEQKIRIYIESDFFSNSDALRLRHAYGEVGPLLVGQTWSTFTDVAAARATLDFEGSVASIFRRQGQARWTQTILDDWLTLALAVEDTRFIVNAPPAISGESRSPSPDFVGHLRIEREWGELQTAYLYRIGGFQETNRSVRTKSAWGMNFTGVLLPTDTSKTYYQILFGDGIGSYRGLPDAVPDTPLTATPLSVFAWMVGFTIDWNESLSSNFTFAEGRLGTTDFQPSSDIRASKYLAANLIAQPLQRVSVGIEYLYGRRKNIDGNAANAHRLQTAFIFDLP